MATVPYRIFAARLQLLRQRLLLVQSDGLSAEVLAMREWLL